MDNITIIQHNVLNWNTRKHNLINTYLQINPHIFLLNSHGVKEEEEIKLPGYINYKVYTTNENNDGSAILIKQNI